MSRKLNRRTFIAGTVAGTAASAFKFPAPAIAQGGPFKIGLLTVKTGPLAQGGIQMEQGIAAFLKEKNNTLAGRKIELLVADTGGNPAGARTKAQEVIERDKVNVILGPLAAFELLAITDYVRDNADAAHQPRGRRGRDAAQDQPVRHPPVGDVRAVQPRDGRLCRQGAQADPHGDHLGGFRLRA